MEAKDGKVVLKCVGVHETKRYLKYELPGELFVDEEPIVLFSSRHIYWLKDDDASGVKEIKIMLGGKVES